MAEIEARCTQCGNENRYEMRDFELKNGTGRSHGTEALDCVECGEVTIHNRSGKSVPKDGGVR